MCSIETSESVKNISAALLEFQRQTHGVVRDSHNPFHKSRYASLEAVIETARPALLASGLAFLQAPGRAVLGSPMVLEVSTMIMHPASGEWIRSTMSLPIVKQDPQGVGSAITYGCRYALMASLGLPPLDDDAEATRHQPEQRRSPEPSIERETDPIGEEVEDAYRFIDKCKSVSDLKAWWRREEGRLRASLPPNQFDAIDRECFAKGQRLSTASVIKSPEAA